jgi:Ca2+-binding EF-hand superfamily protein
LLIEHINFEKDLEDAKIELTLREDFNAVHSFSILDLSGKGYLSATELRDSLYNLGIRLTMDDA